MIKNIILCNKCNKEKLDDDNNWIFVRDPANERSGILEIEYGEKTLAERLPLHFCDKRCFTNYFQDRIRNDNNT